MFWITETFLAGVPAGISWHGRCILTELNATHGGGLAMSQMIPWLPQYEVNVSDIDMQHRELFRMMNELLDATWDGKGKDFIKEALKFMAKYTVDHFATEEAYMRQHTFPGYIEHKQAHDTLTAQVVDFVKTCEEKGVTTETLVAVVLGLGNWTKEHIRGMDQELGQFLVHKGMAQGLPVSPAHDAQAPSPGRSRR
jgi:hemerythrin